MLFFFCSDEGVPCFCCCFCSYEGVPCFCCLFCSYEGVPGVCCCFFLMRELLAFVVFLFL